MDKNKVLKKKLVDMMIDKGWVRELEESEASFFDYDLVYGPEINSRDQLEHMTEDILEVLGFKLGKISRKVCTLNEDEHEWPGTHGEDW
jgi:hypothetical protein